MSNQGQSSVEELWKERMAFTSGSILIWGYFLLQLWPLASRFQTSRQMHFWTLVQEQFFERHIVPEDQLFVLLVILLTLGLWTVALAIFHVLFRGLRLISNPETRWLKTNEVLRVLSEATYTFLFVLNAIAVAFFVSSIILYALIIGSQGLLVRYARLSAAAAYYVVLGIFFLICFLITFFGYIRLSRGKHLDRASQFFKSNQKTLSWSYLLIIVFLLSGNLVTEMTYTVELGINKNIAVKSQEKAIDVTVRLGGSASSLDRVHLTVVGSGQPAEELKLLDLAHGTYVTQIDLAKKQPGVYEVRLQYPGRLSISSSSPFIVGTTSRTQRFLLVE